ncbi:MFS general substrate transporter [Epithele typhae]|uniref:MFS general substrate transporter n=1 Tax=Epithele typhae TaxID=378194 RepID=UPI00200835CF|nr:MFS general substrate transporter [Epithele typhae]KAH9929018.1 MFS general substrate transporter [Epithele typhae]
MSDLKSSHSGAPRSRAAHRASPSVPQASTLPSFDHERALVLKFDIRILPILAVMYLANALDKGNLGNAKTNGLEADLHFHSNDYNIILSVFFVPFVLFAVPVAFVGKKFGSARVLPALMFIFGSMTLLSAAVKNFAGMFAVRWFLGMAESGFFPLIIYYLTTFYRRGELARRLAIFYAASNIANAFSGLLAFGVFHIKDSKIPAWRYLFLIEGAATVLFRSEAWFLTDEERKMAFQRIQMDSSSIVNEEFVLKDALQIFKMPATYAWLLMRSARRPHPVRRPLPPPDCRPARLLVRQDEPLHRRAQRRRRRLLLLLAFSSDYARIRFPFIAAGFLLTFIGFIVYATIDVERELHVAYFATFMMTWGTSAPSVLLSTWYNNNVAHEGRRLALTSVGVPLANVMGLVSSNIFRNRDAPRYIPALIVTAAFGAVGAAVTLCLGAYMVLDNRRMDAREGVRRRALDVSTEKLREGPKSPEFRWFL